MHLQCQWKRLLLSQLLALLQPHCPSHQGGQNPNHPLKFATVPHPVRLPAAVLQAVLVNLQLALQLIGL
jgi:hypothetical protein